MHANRSHSKCKVIEYLAGLGARIVVQGIKRHHYKWAKAYLDYISAGRDEEKFARVHRWQRTTLLATGPSAEIE